MKLFGFIELDVKDIKGLGVFIKRIIRKIPNKSNTYILFIDDKPFPIVSALNDAGWSTERIKDVINLDDEKIKRCQIIFVDYKGVGKKLSKTEEGLAIVKELKRKYQNKKRVIVYSEHTNYGLEGHFRIADNQMSKNSELYEFITMIESELELLR